MNKTQIAAIKKAAKEKYDGNLDVAIAAHLMGDVVIDYCAGQVPAGADLDAIARIRKQLGGKPAAPAKTAVSSGRKRPAAKRPPAKRR